MTQLKSASLEATVLVLHAEGRTGWAPVAYLSNTLLEAGLNMPILLSTAVPAAFDFYDDAHLPEKFRLTTAAKQQLFLAGVSGSLVVDGQIDGIMIRDSNMLNQPDIIWDSAGLAFADHED